MSNPEKNDINNSNSQTSEQIHSSIVEIFMGVYKKIQDDVLSDCNTTEKFLSILEKEFFAVLEEHIEFAKLWFEEFLKAFPENVIENARRKAEEFHTLPKDNTI
jgi:DNA replication initiation complex subunit (GINS family)